MSFWSNVGSGALSFISGGAADTAKGLYKGASTGDWSAMALPDWMPSASQITDAIGLTNEAEKQAAYQNASDTINELLQGNDELYAGIIDALGTKGDTIASLLGGEEAVNGYRDTVANFDGSRYQVDPGKVADFAYGKDVGDFMTPAAQYNIDKSVNAALESMAGAGGMSGGAVARQLQAVASDAATSEYDKAFERMQADRQQAYNQVKDALGIEQNNASMALDADKTVMDAQKGLFDNYLSNMDSTSDDIINALVAQFGNESELKQGIAQMMIDKASQETPVASALGSAGGLVGSILGAII